MRTRIFATERAAEIGVGIAAAAAAEEEDRRRLEKQKSIVLKNFPKYISTVRQVKLPLTLLCLMKSLLSPFLSPLVTLLTLLGIWRLSGRRDLPRHR